MGEEDNLAINTTKHNTLGRGLVSPAGGPVGGVGVVLGVQHARGGAAKCKHNVAPLIAPFRLEPLLSLLVREAKVTLG